MINQATSGLERQIGPFSGLFLDIGPDRDQVPKSDSKESTVHNYKSVELGDQLGSLCPYIN